MGYWGDAGGRQTIDKSSLCVGLFYNDDTSIGLVFVFLFVFIKKNNNKTVFPGSVSCKIQ